LIDPIARNQRIVIEPVTDDRHSYILLYGIIQGLTSFSKRNGVLSLIIKQKYKNTKLIPGDIPGVASSLELKREIISWIYGMLLIDDISNMDQLRSEANSISTFDWQHPSIDIVSFACISMILGHGDGQRPLCFADASPVLDLFIPRSIRPALRCCCCCFSYWQLTNYLDTTSSSLIRLSRKVKAISPCALISSKRKTLSKTFSFFFLNINNILIILIILIIFINNKLNNQLNNQLNKAAANMLRFKIGAYGKNGFHTVSKNLATWLKIILLDSENNCVHWKKCSD